MPKNLSSSHLKIHGNDSPAAQVGSQPSGSLDLEQLMSAFSNATGWTPRPIRLSPRQRNNLTAEEQTNLPLRQRVQLVNNAPIDGLLDAEYVETPVTSEVEAWKLLEQIG